MSASTHCFVYYRVRPEASSQAAEAVRRLVAAVARETAVPGRLMHRRDEPLLWMEVYGPLPEPDAFIARLEELAERHGFGALLVPGGTRKTECFQDAPPCA